ncbi:transporter substrate-binding domain-containing protein [Pseudomonas oryzae]|uniref:General L-amino acid transport system substrate-binding protein n=1 Tax=Pseudomonas oryzae TaxID=1392877 RepID=A0A1H1YN23_9PSED|nr:transporter substrate-binding domain-containing protein [Pseudomonas oryzae]SDT22794.1 general L-amino acid transport system substrate-binding protein [Pseudomonas oryzae]
MQAGWRRNGKRLGAALLGGLWLIAGGVAADTLERVQARGALRCAVDGTPGFGGIDGSGRPAGFDVDFCRAVAAAVLGSGAAVEIERVNTANKFKALARGEVDIAFGMATWTYGRDLDLGVRFVTPTFFDGQALMVWADSPVRRMEDARGRTVCVQAGTTTAANLDDLSRSRDLALRPLPAAQTEERLNRFIRRDCELVSGDRSELAASRASRIADPARWRLLDETLSREPLGPYVAAGDERWFNLVRWVINVTLLGELHGLGGDNLGGVDARAGQELQALAGRQPGLGKALGLDDGWAREVLVQVGNYGQIYERNLGSASPLALPRGFNRLWRDGGLFFPPPLR